MGKGGGSGQGKGEGAGQGAGAYRAKSERFFIPAMPMPVAVICCIFNFLIPGFGTMMAGFSNFCCSRNEDMDRSARVFSCFINFGIGFLQLFTFIFCLVGWGWSCVWGGFFIVSSADYYHNNRVDDVDRNGQVIVQQPGCPRGVVVRQPMYNTPRGSNTFPSNHAGQNSIPLPPSYEAATAGTGPDPPPPYQPSAPTMESLYGNNT